MFCFLRTWNTLWILPEHDFCYGKRYFIRQGAKLVSKPDCPDWALCVSQEEHISTPHVKSEDLVNKINALQNWSFHQLTHAQKGLLLGRPSVRSWEAMVNETRKVSVMLLSQKCTKDPAVLSFQNSQQVLHATVTTLGKYENQQIRPRCF